MNPLRHSAFGAFCVLIDVFFGDFRREGSSLLGKLLFFHNIALMYLFFSSDIVAHFSFHSKRLRGDKAKNLKKKGGKQFLLSTFTHLDYNASTTTVIFAVMPSIKRISAL